MTGYSDAGAATGPAGSLPLPLPLPGTPHHIRRGADIDNLIRSLEDKWRIGLKLRSAEWSPKKSAGSTDDLADKIYGIVKRLFFSAQPALNDAINTFEEQASRTAPRERLRLLYRILLSKTKKDGGPVSRTGTPKNEPPKSLASALPAQTLEEVPNTRKSNTPSQSTRPTRPSRTRRNDESEWYTTAVEPGSSTDVDTDDEMNPDFETPHSPSPTPSSRPAQTLFQASKPVSLQHNTRKRPSDSPRCSERSKLTKTSNGKQTIKEFMSSPIPPPQFKKPTLGTARSARSFQAAAASVPSSANTSFNSTVFSSQETAATNNTSFTSYDGANDSRDNTIREPKWRTRTSPTTIDGSLADHDPISYPGSEVVEQDIQRDLNQVFFQGSSGQSESTFGSVDEDVLRDASCEVENKQVRSGSGASPMIRDSTAPAVGMAATASFSPSPPPQGKSKDQSRTTTASESPTKLPHYVRNMASQNLFVPTLPVDLEGIPYFLLFICQRIATNCSTTLQLQKVLQGMDVRTVSSDPEAFWRFIELNTNIPHVKLRESSRLWQASKRQFDGYTFKGNITLNTGLEGPLLSLKLLPVQADKSCRLQRMFGSDRFLYLNSPLFNSSKSARLVAADMQQVRSQWLKWLLAEHSFLGRKWRAFHIEDVKRAKTTRRKDVVHDKRIVLFATEGCGIERPCSIGSMLNQFLPFATNENQGFCKAFTRIDLGLSRTIPTIVFESDQLQHVGDQLATPDQEDTQFNDQTLRWLQFPDGTVMNDGCSIISVGAALEIWRQYKDVARITGPLPSAFQGRIGGAKGLWMISAESFTKDPYHLAHWIQISGSQWKFDPPADRSLYHHRTFELSNYSSAPSPSELHISFIPILIDRGVPREIIASLMFDCLDSERKKLLELLPDSVRAYDWVHRNGTKTRVEALWQAALPVSLEEKVKLLLESGFSPLKFPFLAKSLQRFIQTKQILQESKLRVPLAKSAFLYGIADPFGVLEPGEIQVQFSSSFVDETTDEKYLCLRDMEVLVARQPACRRSDIQKVRTVVRPKLSHLVDVVVFSSKGRYPLAGKLQGGDYDGDMFWICWESALVKPFKNAPAPVLSPDPKQYGIETRTEKLKDVTDVSDPNDVDTFLRKAFEFRNNPSLLGLVTIFAEKQAYSENRIYSETLEQLYDMHDLLVDASKQGYVFTQAGFERYVRRLPKQPKQPIYKTAMEDCANARDAIEVEKIRKKDYRYRSNRILDYLYFDIVRAHNIETMEQVKKMFSKATDLDEHLLYPSKYLSEEPSETIRKELASLTEKLDSVYLTWNVGCHRRDFTTEDFNAVVDDCYQKYRAVQPDNPNDSDIRPLVKSYLVPGKSQWDTIKASALYSRFRRPEKLNFVFMMAGRELVQLKSDNYSNARHMTSFIHANMKPKLVKAPIQYDEVDEEDDFKTALEEPILE